MIILHRKGEETIFAVFRKVSKVPMKKTAIAIQMKVLEAKNDTQGMAWRRKTSDDGSESEIYALSISEAKELQMPPDYDITDLNKSDEGLDIFQHSPLNLESHEMRFLVLKPHLGDVTSPILYSFSFEELNVITIPLW